MTKLLCATDLLPKSEAAIERAALLAEELGARLALLHVVSPFAPQKVLEQTLQNAIERMRARVRSPEWRAKSKASAGVLVGNPRRLIVGSMAREEADLLIIGPHRERGAVNVIHDTIAEKAVSARQCPVLIVRHPARTAYRRILLALDMEVESANALRTAERLGLTRSAQAAVMHAHASPSSESMSVRDRMHGFIRCHSGRGDRYELLVTDGPPAPAIMREIDNLRPDLLVMGSRGLGRIGRTVGGSVANDILKQARCDILIAPRSELAAQDERDIKRWEAEGGRLK